MKKRNWFRSIMAAVLTVSMLGISACGVASQPAQAPAAAPAASSAEAAAPAAPSAADGETYVIKYCHSQPEDHFTHLALLDMKAYIEEKSGGRLVLELFPNGQLGGDRQLIESVQMGTLEMCNAVAASFSASAPAAGVFDLPFLFASDEEAYKVLDGEVGQAILEKINEQANGYRVMTFGVSGLRHITNNVRPIHTPDDLKGLKIRTMENQVHLDAFKLLGANPTPMSIGEVFTALQQGTVDGQENPIGNIYGYKFNEVQKYLSMTAHVYQPQFDVISTKFWDSLPDDLKTILEEGEVLRRGKQREYAKEYEENALEEIKKTTEVNELTAEEMQLFRDACAPIYDKYKDQIGADVVDVVLETIM